MVYVDGVQDNAAKGGSDTPGGIIVDKLAGGGTLKVFPYYSQVVYLTEVNLWNIILTAQEIAESSKSCIRSPRNVKKCSDFWSGFLSADKSRYQSPSQCRSRPRASSASEGIKEWNPAAVSENAVGWQDKVLLKIEETRIVEVH